MSQVFSIINKPAVGTKLVLLSDQVAHTYNQYGRIFMIDDKTTVNRVLNTKKNPTEHNFQETQIKAAFNIPATPKGDLVTIGELNVIHFSFKE